MLALSQPCAPPPPQNPFQCSRSTAPSPASRSTINTAACSRMSVSAHPLQCQATYCHVLCFAKPHSLACCCTSWLGVAVVLWQLCGKDLAAAAAAALSWVARAFFMLQPGCSNNAQANEACARPWLHVAIWHAHLSPTFLFVQRFSTLCGIRSANENTASAKAARQYKAGHMIGSVKIIICTNTETEAQIHTHTLTALPVVCF